MKYMKLSDFGQVIMGMSPSGETYNEKGEGLPLLNGPTEFTSTCPIPKLYTTDSKRECKVGDLFFCVRGSTTGKMNWADQVFSIGRGVCAIRGKNTIDTKYIKYCIEQNLSGLLAIACGGTFPNLKKDDIGNFEIPIINNRQRIVEVLSAYDDLIENNLKRIKLLEETAQNIYKEWFVNFRFPNYEHTEFDEESGLPKGWEIKKISSIVEFKGGFPFKSSEYTESGKYRIVTIKNVGDRFFDGNNTSGIENIPDKMKEYCKLQEGNILMSLTGNIGRTCLVYGENYLLNQRVVIVTPINSENSAFCYFLFNTDSIKGLMNNLSSGVAQQNLSPVKLEEQLIPLPPMSLMLKYSSATNGIVNQIISLNKHNGKLKEARDILLPRLMNRTIEV